MFETVFNLKRKCKHCIVNSISLLRTWGFTGTGNLGLELDIFYLSYLKHQLTLLIVHARVGDHRLAELFLHIFQLLLQIPNILIEAILRAVCRASSRVVTSVLPRSSCDSIW